MCQYCPPEVCGTCGAEIGAGCPGDSKEESPVVAVIEAAKAYKVASDYANGPDAGQDDGLSSLREAQAQQALFNALNRLQAPSMQR